MSLQTGMILYFLTYIITIIAAIKLQEDLGAGAGAGMHMLQPIPKIALIVINILLLISVYGIVYTNSLYYSVV